MPKLKPGQILHDNDPRYSGRKLEVVRVERFRVANVPDRGSEIVAVLIDGKGVIAVQDMGAAARRAASAKNGGTLENAASMATTHQPAPRSSTIAGPMTCISMRWRRFRFERHGTNI